MGSYRLMRLFGIDILVHWSWLAIFALLTWWLAQGFFKDEYGDWTSSQRWGAAVAASLTFFISILLHELAHSLVAKREGLQVKNITLFIFGGVSSLGSEPTTPGQEFRVAIVGPLVSFILAFFFGIATAVAFLSGVENSPPAAVAVYLTFINFAIGVFNMLPGYPLDGGRVLRAGLWARGRNLLTATRRASMAGTFISFGLIALGVVSILLGNFIGGAWFIVIGWFLRNVSEASYQQVLSRSTLEGTKVADLVNRSFEAAPPDVSLSALVNQHMLAGGQRCVPIVVGAELLGLVTMRDLKRVAREEWESTSAFRAMTPREKLHGVDAHDDIAAALEIMARENVNQLPVMEFGRFVGFVTRADVLRLMQVRSELGGDRGTSSGAR
ncbi:MAG: site-2 protease family protein [Dehalococcoidia bacterium]